MNEEDWYNKIKTISGTGDKYAQYADFYQQKRYEDYEREERQRAITEDHYNELQRQVAAMYANMKQKTHEEKMNEKIFCMNDICALIDALSLGISDPSERESFDKMVRNWRDDRLREI